MKQAPCPGDCHAVSLHAACRRACGRADAVTLYAYGGGRTAEVWWQQNEAQLAKQEKLTVKSVSGPSSKALAAMADRSLNLQCMVQDGEVWMSDDQERLQVELQALLLPAA